MSKIIWGELENKVYETGIDQVALYPMVSGGYPLGVPWDGVKSVKQSPGGAEAKPFYADNQKYFNLMSAETFGATIEAFNYPDEFAVLNGFATVASGATIGQQVRKQFGLAYRTLIGNSEGSEDAYKIHIIYGAQAAPTEMAYNTTGESPDPVPMSWTLSTTPVKIPNYKPTATFELDSRTTPPAKMAIIEGILYGTESSDARLPLPAEIISIIGEASINAMAVSTIVPADAATAIAVGASIIITFNNTVVKEAISVISNTGNVIAGTKSFDASGRIMTFKPSSNLAAATKHYVVIAGVSDNYGQSLATVTKSFTTA